MISATDFLDASGKGVYFQTFKSKKRVIFFCNWFMKYTIISVLTTGCREVNKTKQKTRIMKRGNRYFLAHLY